MSGRGEHRLRGSSAGRDPPLDCMPVGTECSQQGACWGPWQWMKRSPGSQRSEHPVSLRKAKALLAAGGVQGTTGSREQAGRHFLASFFPIHLFCADN